MKDTMKKSLSVAMGATFVAAMSASPVATADTNPFGMQSLDHGYMQLAEGKCGNNKDMDKSKEGKCGNKKDMDKAKEGKCGENKGMDKGMKKGMEGKCGEGKCGATKKQEG
jgi:uncharacterized low-complexity protein